MNHTKSAIVRPLLAVVPMILARVFSAAGATIDVTAGDGNALIQAIEQANSTPEGDVIRLEAGATYSFPNKPLNAQISGDLVIEGTDTTIDNGYGTIARIGVDSRLTMRRTTVVCRSRAFNLGDDAFAIVGGTMVMEGGSVRACGGAFYIAGSSTLTLSDVTVEDNRGIWKCGGAVYVDGGTMRVFRSRFLRNIAEGGGLSPHACESGCSGGAICAKRGSSLFVTDSVFRGNRAHAYSGASGGAIQVEAGGTVVIERSEISSNAVSGGIFAAGGGISSGGDLTLLASTVSGNSVMGAFLADANSHGGGLSLSGNAVLNGVTVAYNTVEQGVGSAFGGGIAADGIVRAANTIIARNTAASGPDCGHSTGSGMRSEGHVLVRDPSGCDLIAGEGDVMGRDPVLGLLDDNGGPTRTHALLSGSPAIDAGSAAAPDVATVCTRQDQRCHARPGGARCDVGGFELDGSAEPCDPPTIASCGVRAATYPSIVCRLEVLEASVAPLERATAVRNGFRAASRRTGRGWEFVLGGQPRRAMPALMGAVRRLRTIDASLRFGAARRAVPSETRKALIAENAAIRADLRALRRATRTLGSS